MVVTSLWDSAKKRKKYKTTKKLKVTVQLLYSN